MAELRCPHCGQVFDVDGSELDSIVRQIRDGEFRREVDERVEELVKHLSEQHEIELKAKDNELKAKESDIKLKSQEEYSKEVKRLSEQLQKAEAENQKLKASVDAAADKQKLAVQDAVRKYEGEVNSLKMTVAEEENKRRIAVLEAVGKVEKEKQNLERRLVSEKEKHDMIVAQKDTQIEFYRDLKTKTSVKMLGETLEQHCEIQFNQLRATAFRNAYFEKDNDSRTGSKGDYIYRENDEFGNEIVSIMFEMKNEQDETSTKHKNEDFFKELDKDRKEKNCEYAVLVSMLESDSELYNGGIVDVSYKYDKMYVVRPQCFIPIITLLRNAAMNALSYKQELAVVRSQNIDITNFEDNLMKFKDDFGRNYAIAHDHFDKAIDEIDKTIQHLEKVKKELMGSDNQLRIANGKVEDVTVKKLTKDNPTMKAEFDKIRKQKQEDGKDA
ncbi:MAG: DUF2130 domain-containing protein [Lachnospiraceae bacterium]|nr:DUF2130 domain-containing protein [Lachnospiraceae bacterium]MBR5732292.1 DUF2130 domain-containing protein [Lachnospiraceae bacterium]